MSGHSSTTNGLKLDLRLTSERYAQFSNKSCGDLLDQPGFKAIHDAIQHVLHVCSKAPLVFCSPYHNRQSYPLHEDLLDLAKCIIWRVHF